MDNSGHLDDSLLESFMNGFFGYGSYDAPIWFIGMEEGGGNSELEIKQRIYIWEKRGRRELEDVAEYHRELAGAMKSKLTTEPHQEDISRDADQMLALFDENDLQTTRIQPTWSKLIRVLLSIRREQPIGPDDIWTYQAKKLGRSGQSETCLLELLPLPSPSTEDWLYRSISPKRDLKYRETYHAAYAPKRADTLRERIRQHRPRVVVFYGLSYRCWWEKIADQDFTRESIGKGELWSGTDDHTGYYAMSHPAARGLDNLYFEQIGERIAGDT